MLVSTSMDGFALISVPLFAESNAGVAVTSYEVTEIFKVRPLSLGTLTEGVPPVDGLVRYQISTLVSV